MFYGAAVKPNSPVTLNADGGLVLHISGACLSNPTSDERTYLVLHHDDKNHVLCCLRKDHDENIPLDIFVSTQSGAQLKVQGKSDVHVIGYFEPMDDGSDIPSDDEEGLALDDEDESTQVSSDEEKSAPHLSKVKKIEELQDDDDDDEDKEDNDEEEEDDNDDDDDDEELRLALQQQLAQKAAKATKKNVKQQAVAPNQKQSDKKRKAGQETSAAKPEKQQKVSSTGAGLSQDFEKALTTYLKKHGRSLISQIASACPKPSAISSKYREFLVSRPSLFVVEGQHAALKA